MKKKLFTLTLLNIIVLFSYGQYSVVLIDSITEGIKFIDNNYYVEREDFGQPVRAYKLTEKLDDFGLSQPAIVNTDTMAASSWLTGAFNCFDYMFPNEIIRAPGDTIKIEFDLMFSALSGSGEGGRLNISLVTGLPEGTPFPGIEFPLAPGFDTPPVNFSAWQNYTDGGTGSTTRFGAPTYHLWFFSGSYGPALAYGGDFPRWPGWNSGAGGYYYNRNFGDNQTAVNYNTSDNYPLVPYSKKQSGGSFVSATRWKRYTWLITDQMIHLYIRDSEKGPEANEEMLFMAIPKEANNISFINEAHGTNVAQMPPEYKWYERMNAIRFYLFYSGDRKAYLSNIVITKTGTPVSTYAEFQNRPASQRRPRADAGSYELPVFLYNGEEGGTSSVTVDLVKGDNGHVDGFTTGTVIFENTTSDLQSSTIALTLTDMYMNEPDTLIFQISEVTGGFYPTAGPGKNFELIIRPSGADPVNVFDSQLRFVELVPNPATDHLYIVNNDNNLNYRSEIYDISGKLIYQNDFQNDDKINITGIKNGIYFIKLYFDEGVITRKFIKQ